MLLKTTTGKAKLCRAFSVEWKISYKKARDVTWCVNTIKLFLTPINNNFQLFSFFILFFFHCLLKFEILPSVYRLSENYDYFIP
jgi:hypothetical protein